MTIHINPNRINVQSGGAGKLSDRKQRETAANPQPVIPKRAHVNTIPSPESLATMIRSAVASFRQGTVWDRGTILNLLA